MNHHTIKILPEHYNNVKAGTKTFEIRNNDRAYQKGDTLTLTWYDGKPEYYCGSLIHPHLKFTVGDVYPIDATRVVFSLLPPPERTAQDE